MPWRPHGHAKVDARSPSAFAVCDRCYRLFNRRDLVWEEQWFGPRLMRTGFLVCTDGCLDVPQAQLRPKVVPPDPVPIFHPRPEFYSIDDGLQGFTLYTLPPDPDSAPVWPQSYVLAQVALVSGVATPGTLVNHSGTIALSQVAQTLVPGQTTRQYLLLFNPQARALAMSFGTASLGATSSIVVNTGQALLWAYTTGNVVNPGAMTVAGTLPGQAYYAWTTPV